MITRFAPSPTGYLHVGGVRTALYSWLYARHHGGTYILRIEDTDRERSTQAAVDAILDGLAWLGLSADAEPVYQTRRFDRYRAAAQRLLEEGSAYRCYCTREELETMRAEAQAKGLKPRYDGRCRDGSRQRDDVSPVVRFKNPQSGEVVLEDLVKGRIVFDNAELDDLIIVRSDGTPTYNFTVVVDDADMRITHVIRGDDHVNNTPRQINMLRALGATAPAYAHLPMINGPDGAKLSKRHGAVSVLEYKEMGFLPDALLNYLLRLGWSHGDQEIFTRDEMIALFDLDAVNRSAANFDTAKLRWVNQQHILKRPIADLGARLAEQLQADGVALGDGPPPEAVAEALRERSTTIVEMAERALVYYADFGHFEPAAAQAHLKVAAREPLAKLSELFDALEDWSAPSIEATVKSTAAALGLGMGKLAQPLRVAVTGQAASPGIGVTLALIGKPRTIERIGRALDFIDAANSESAPSAG